MTVVFWAPGSGSGRPQGMVDPLCDGSGSRSPTSTWATPICATTGRWPSTAIGIPSTRGFCLLGKLVFRPNPYWEFPFLHLVNFAIYVAGLGCAHFFLIQLHRRNQLLDDSPRWRGTLSVPAWALLALGYSLYIWSSLDLIDFTEGADLLLAAFLYLAFGLLLRIEAEPAGWRPFILLGAGSGTRLSHQGGDVSSDVRLSGHRLVVRGGSAQGAAAGAGSAAGLLRCHRPFHRGALEVQGEIHLRGFRQAHLRPLRHDGLPDNWSPPYFHWQGGFPDAGVPKHPTRKIFSSPDIYEFDAPFQATYGAWYDPTYWYEGVIPHVNLRNQIRVLLWNAREYFRLFVLTQPVLVAGLFILVWMSWRPGFRPKDTAISAVLLLPAIAAFSLYGLVHYVEWRYVAPFSSSPGLP